MNDLLNTSKAMFITIEGVDCAGKTSNLGAINALLTKHNVAFTQTREPGGTQFAEEIREMIFRHTAESGIDPMTELMMFYISRLEHCSKLIVPTLEAGTSVICDRFYDSSLAYQGAREDMDSKLMRSLHDLLNAANLMRKPDKTILYDIPAEVYAERKICRGTVAGEEVNGLESRTLDYFKKVRYNFLELAAKEPDRFIIIDASKPLEEVQAHTERVVKALFSL